MTDGDVGRILLAVDALERVDAPAAARLLLEEALEGTEQAHDHQATARLRLRLAEVTEVPLDAERAYLAAVLATDSALTARAGSLLRRRPGLR